MSIPKGLRIYKAKRYQENFPTNIKYGYSSDHLVFSPSTQHSKPNSSFYYRHQKKLVSQLSLTVNDKKSWQIQATKTLARCKDLKKLTLSSYSCWIPEGKLKLMIKFIQRMCRILKKIKVFVFNLSSEIHGSFKVFKSLLLLNSLESLVFFRIHYYEKIVKLKPLIQALKVASKRSCWPNFKSLKIPPLTSESLGTKFEESQCVEILENLNEFMQDLACIEDIYKRTSFQIALGEKMGFPCGQVDRIWEVIRRAGASVIKIDVGCAEYFPKISDMVRPFTNLKTVRLAIRENFKQKIGLQGLSELPAFQELTLQIEEKLGGKKGVDFSLYRDLLIQISTLKNLTSLSLEFHGMQVFEEELKLSLSRVLSNLLNLQGLKLEFRKERDRKRDKFVDGTWLGDVFQEIGNLVKLKKLLLSFGSFQFTGLITVLSESFAKLTEISDLSLKIVDADIVKEEELLMLWQSVSRLTKMERLCLDFSKYDAFSANLFVELMDCIVKNFPCISFLWMRFSRIYVTERCYERIAKAIRDLRCLNDIMVKFGVQLISSNLKFELLVGEIHKRMSGNIYIE